MIANPAAATKAGSRARRFSPRFTTLIAIPLVAVLGTFSMTAQAWDWGFGWGKNVSGSGNIKTETRNVSGFTSIALNLPATVELRQGTTEGLTIESDDNLLPLIETVVESGSLKLRPMEKNTHLKTKTMKLIVNFKTIDTLAVAGSGDFVASSLKTASLKASIAGSGDVRIKSLTTDYLKISIAGSGDFTAGGKATVLEASIAGSGDIRADKLEAKNVKVSVAGSGDAAVWATETLKVSVAGSGDVKYYGDAQLTKSIAGSGSATRMGAAPAAQ